MKLPKKVNRYCPHCKKHTEHKVSQVSTGHKRGAMKRGSIQRAKKRGRGRGMGNKGKWGSKPAVSQFNRKTKSTKKTNTMYTCQICKKSHYQKKGKRTGKITIEEKMSKSKRAELGASSTGRMGGREREEGKSTQKEMKKGGKKQNA